MKMAPLDIRDLITPAYLAEQRVLHAAPRGYGAKGQKWADVVVRLLQSYEAFSVLDYGCGQGSLARALHAREIPGLRIAEYDPAIPGKNGPPDFADLVTCTDVLEHVEPDKLPAVLLHLRKLARKAVFVVVALDPTNKVLTDGRNAHLIVQSPAWWIAQIEAAGLQVEPSRADLLPAHYTPEKARKRWVAVLRPTC